MSSVVDSVGSMFGSESEGSKAARHASSRQMGYQQQGLDYLQERDEIPRYLKDQATWEAGGKLGLAYGAGEQGYTPESLQTGGKWVDRFNRRDLESLEMTPENQAAWIEQSRTSPLYNAIMGGQQAGEESILRNAAATGGFRSGNTQENLYEYNKELENRAMLESYNQLYANKAQQAGGQIDLRNQALARRYGEYGTQMAGYGAMMNLPTYDIPIANQYNTMGGTYAKGRIGQQEAQAASQEEGMGYAMDTAKFVMLSDRRLKKDIKKIGVQNGLNFYTWAWNKVGESLGLFGEAIGHIADEVKAKYPDAVTTHKSSFLMVDYGKIGD